MASTSTDNHLANAATMNSNALACFAGHAQGLSGKEIADQIAHSNGIGTPAVRGR